MTQHLTTGERVAWYRHRRGLSQDVLAGLVGRTADWLGKAENNRIELDRLSVIRTLAHALDVSIGDLIGEPTLLEWSKDSGRRTLPALREALMDYRQLAPLIGTPVAGELPTLCGAPLRCGRSLGRLPGLLVRIRRPTAPIASVRRAARGPVLLR
ncbi:helix-turn-helix domain-containing protein [Streptomyces decoyicus]|uniref:helix-turn-helix domain-containing protein n=1 Tax=Streptomyces decoyicus TaxID=249567 RepID=UPI00362C5482